MLVPDRPNYQSVREKKSERKNARAREKKE